MAAKSPERRRLSAQVAITTRHHPDDPGIPALRAELATEGLADWITRTLASAPPLSPGQLARLRALLRPGDGHAAT